MSRMTGLSPSQFQRFHMNETQIVEGLLLLNFLRFDSNFVDEDNIAELAGQSVR